MDSKGKAHCIVSKLVEIDKLKQKIDRDAHQKKSKFNAVFDALKMNPITLAGTR